MPMSQRLLRPLSRPAQGFAPPEIAGLQLWLDAADSATLTVSTGVSAWRDKSPTGSIWAQISSTSRPATGTQTINGRNVLVFDGFNDSLSANNPLNAAMPVTFFWVYRIAEKTNFGMTHATGLSSIDFNIRQRETTGGVQVLAGGQEVLATTADMTGKPLILSWVVPAGGTAPSRMFLDGAELSITNATAKPILTGTHFLGRRGDGFFFNGWMAEIIAYAAALTDTQRRSVEAYLGRKWGITLA